MERQRFSGKELLKNAKTNPVIPEGYQELKSSELKHQTDKAFLIQFVRNEKTHCFWFPKEFIINQNNKFYAADWLLKNKID